MFELADWHGIELGDSHAGYFHVASFGAQARAVALRAEGFATVARQHHAILYLVEVFLDHFEESVDAGKTGVAVPKEVFLGLRQVAIRAMDREAARGGDMHQLAFPHAHFLTLPAGDSVFINR